MGRDETDPSTKATKRLTADTIRTSPGPRPPSAPEPPQSGITAPPRADPCVEDTVGHYAATGEDEGSHGVKNRVAEGPGYSTSGATVQAGKTQPKPLTHAEILRTAILSGNNSQMQKTLSKHPDLANKTIGSLGMPAHYVISHGNGDGTERERLDMLRILQTTHGIDWDVAGPSKWTPLHLACCNLYNFVEIAKFLLEHGANPNLLDSIDCSPLHFAVAEGRKDMVNILLGDPRTKVSTPGNNGRTALHKAAFRGHLEIVTLLLSHEPDAVDLRYADGCTALHDASRLNRPDVVERLIEGNADVNAKTKEGATPLHLAAISNAVAAAKVLLRANAWVFIVDNANRTPEMVAERMGHTAMLDLLRTPMDVDARLAGSGQHLRVSEATASQQAASKQFDGFVWPSVDGRSKYDKASVFDMLYQDNPMLKETRRNRGVRWIHIPSNNVSRAQMVVRYLYL